MKPKRLLILNHNVIGKSTYHRCFSIARELTLLNYEITLLTNSINEKIRLRQYQNQKVTIVECPDLLWGSLRTGWDPINVIRRCIYLRNKKFDIIHAFDTRPTVILPALFYKRFVKNIPLVIDWSDWWGRGGAISLRSKKILNLLFSPLETFFEEYFRRFAIQSTAASEVLKKRAINLGIIPKSITVIPNGSDTSSIFPINKKIARSELNLPQMVKICIFPGFVLYDLKMVLEAFNYAHEHFSNSLLILLGEFPPYFIASDAIKIIGNVDKSTLNRYLSASDVGMLPMADNLTNQARFPVKFGDYLASGLPVVTNNVGAVGKYTQKYKLGLISSFKAKEMGKAILWLFKHSYQCNIISVNNRKFASNQFSWKKFALKINHLYTKCLKSY